MDVTEADYVLAVIGARCGDEIAAKVVSAEVLVAVMLLP
jgi:hypothetical protein